MYKKEAQGQKKRKHLVPDQEFDGRCGASGADTGYPQEALEDIFLYLDMIEKKCGVRVLAV
jgi:hypothetical protein